METIAFYMRDISVHGNLFLYLETRYQARNKIFKVFNNFLFKLSLLQLSCVALTSLTLPIEN